MRWTMISTIDNNLNRTADEVLRNIHVMAFGAFGSSDTVISLRSSDVLRTPGITVQLWQTRERSEPIDPIRWGGTRTPTIDDTNIAPLDAEALVSESIVYSDAIVDDLPRRVATFPFYNQTGHLLGVVQLAAPTQTVNEATDKLLIITIVTCGAAIVAAFVIGWWLANRALQPLDDITQAATRIAETDDLSTRLKWRGPMDELGRLARVFNRMMQQLEHLFSVEQRFVADVSHELRTPLTAIRGNLEIIKRYGMDEASLEAIDSEVDRMSRLVSDLLLLARADYGEIEVDLYPLDLDTLVLEVFQQAQILAKDRNLEIAIEHFVPLRINGNADRIKQLLLNLTSNAIKFTPDGGKITLGLQPRGGWAVVYVRDTGIGMKRVDLEHIFDRFYQADTSRSQNSTQGGSGLGLSIAQWIVDAHGGTIEADSVFGKGSTFTIKLPILGKVQIKPLELDDEESERPVRQRRTMATRLRETAARRRQRQQQREKVSHR